RLPELPEAAPAATARLRRRGHGRGQEEERRGVLLRPAGRPQEADAGMAGRPGLSGAHRRTEGEAMTAAEGPARARGMMQIARARLASDYPYHAALVARGRLEEDAGVGTMAVTVRDGSLRFLYCPAFVNGCTPDELAAVLHHEV